MTDWFLNFQEVGLEVIGPVVAIILILLVVAVAVIAVMLFFIHIFS